MSEPRNKIALFGKTFVLPDCSDRSDNPSDLRKVLFGKPSCLIYKIKAIYRQIRLNNPEQTQNILEFFLWLLEHFLPFLDHCEQYIGNVRLQVDIQLLEHIPPLEEIISTLRNHFSVVPLQILRCMIVTVSRPIPRGRYQSEISRNPYLTAVGIAYLKGYGPEVQWKMMWMFHLTQRQLTEIHMYLSHFPRIREKSFWRRVHVVTIALNFLIRKFLGDKIECMSHLIMRVLGGL